MSRKTRANFIAVERLRQENRMLQRQIDCLLSEIKEISDNPQRISSCYDFCPSNCSDLGCEFTWYDGCRDRPNCSACWREHARRCAE